MNHFDPAKLARLGLIWGWLFLGVLGSYDYRHDQPERTHTCEHGSVVREHASSEAKQGNHHEGPA
jgi:hypothetical protein